jgi:hypothetical protein
MSEGQEPILVPFEPELPASTNGNGSHVRHRRRLMTGVIFGILLGGLIATNYVPRLQWLNLAQIGSWERPMIAAGIAGAMVGVFRRDDFRLAFAGGAIAAVVAIWGVYVLVRISVHPLFVDRSITRVVIADLARLFLYSAPAGALGAAVAWNVRFALLRLRAR